MKNCNVERVSTKRDSHVCCVGHTPFYVQCKENTSNSIYYKLWSDDALLRLKGLKKGRVDQEKKVHF